MRIMPATSRLYAAVVELELRHLRCLVAVVDCGSFTDAAVELGVSQAAVSRTLIRLEGVLGVRLLPRTSRDVTPTTTGVQVLARPGTCSSRPTSWSPWPPPATPGCGSATPGRRWGVTPRSSSAGGPSGIRTSSCS